GFDTIGSLLFPPTELAHQATVGVTLLPQRSKLFESHWSNQWLTSVVQLPIEMKLTRSRTVFSLATAFRSTWYRGRLKT
ncbi:hypothetical protein, partial [Leptolyngbya sp. FACHB-8]|uniref:hypothetical protein n=1 Tax=unclassified Leptolyngbya TaxID=2650499 RepID=UPI001A7E7845